MSQSNNSNNSNNNASNITTADNGYMYGSASGAPIDVTSGGNVATAKIFERIVNVGKMVLRTGTVYQLPDCACTSISIYAWATNKGKIWVGGITTQKPAPEVGLPLVAGSKFEPDCTNANYWSITPDYDADNVSITINATAQANNVQITPQDPASIDSTPPSVVVWNPPNSTTNQYTTIPIWFQTNVKVDPSTITAANIVVASNPPLSSYTVTQDSTNQFQIDILYSGSLATNTSYNIQVSNLKNTYGFAMTAMQQATFTTGTATNPSDLTPPTLTSEYPTANLTNVDVTTYPLLVFDKPIAPACLNTNSIQLTDTDGTPAFVSGLTFTQSADQKTITVKTPSSLSYSTDYRIDVWNTSPGNNGIYDTFGVYLDKKYSIPFTTAAAPPPSDNTPPSLTSEYPTANQTGVSINVQPTLVFNKAIASASVNSTSIELTDTDGTPAFVSGLTFTQSADQKTVTMVPPAVLKYSTDYRIDVWNTNSGTNGIYSTSNIYLDKTYSIPFTTAAAPISYTVRYNVSGNGSYINIGYYSGGAYQAGLWLSQTGTSALVGKIPVHFEFTLKRISSLTLAGNVILQWKRTNSSNAQVPFQTLWTAAASSIPTTDTVYTVDISTNTDAFQKGDFICIDWESGNASNHLLTPYSNTNVFDGANTCYAEGVYGSSSLQIFTGADMAMVIGCSN